MLLNKDLPHDMTTEHVNITFCGKGKCKCPSIDMDLNRDKIIIGGKEEGYTEFTKEDTFSVDASLMRITETSASRFFMSKSISFNNLATDFQSLYKGIKIIIFFIFLYLLNKYHYYLL